MKNEMLSILRRNGNKDVVVKLSCFPTRFLCGVSRFFISDEWSSVRNKIGRCRIKCGKTPNLMGFTLIELLVVVLIIGILAAVALPKYEMAVWKARFSTLKSTVNTFAQAEEAYYMANGTYTVDADELSVSFSGITSSSVNDTCGTYYYPWGRCNLYHQAEVGSHVECVLIKNEESFLSYARYFQNAPAAHGKQYCGAFNSSSASDVQQRICKSESGLSTPTSGDGITYGGYAW